MKALIRDRYGPPDVLEVRDIERPAPKECEVLVRVHAASINDWDWQMLQRPMLALGFNTPRVRILGSDIAGCVAAVGSGVERFTVGDEVHGDLSGSAVRLVSQAVAVMAKLPSDGVSGPHTNEVIARLRGGR